MKKELRKTLKAKRKSVTNKAEKDKLICDNLFSSPQFSCAETVLLYSSLEDEINTKDCIIQALNSGKRVALPSCLDAFGNMEFYYINSLNDLINGYFGVREPNINKCNKVIDFDNSICIVPGISFDKRGFRLGYGKGFYDRFLARYSGISIGVCYDELLCEELPIDKYDLPVNFIATQNSFIATR